MLLLLAACGGHVALGGPLDAPAPDASFPASGEGGVVADDCGAPATADDAATDGGIGQAGCATGTAPTTWLQGCTLAIDLPGGTCIAASLVNATLTDRGVQHVLGNEASNGWTFDDAANRRSIVLHGSACAGFNPNGSTPVTLILGCATVH